MQLCNPDVVIEARTWLGTKYVHQAMVNQGGVDCVGLVIGVGMALGLLDITEEEFAPFAAYSRQPNPKKMMAAMKTWLKQVDSPDTPGPGCIAFIQWRKSMPMHLAIIGDIGERQTLIHAYANVGKVVEHDFSALWQSRVHSYWRYPPKVK